MLRFLLSLLLASSLGQETPRASGPVTDLADLVSAEMEARLTDGLEAARAEGVGDVRVLTVPSLGGRPIEELALRVAEASRIGSAERDDGVLLLVAAEDREMRIETGRGVEAVLTDAGCFEITRKILRPRFREQAYDEGLLEAVTAILSTLRGEEVVFPESPATSAAAEGGVPSRLRLHAPPLWSVLTALGALILAPMVPRRALGGSIRGLLLGAALLAVPIGHAARSGHWLGTLALACFCVAAACWAFASPRLRTLRAPVGSTLEWMFKRPWAMPFAHLVAFPMWLVRRAGGEGSGYPYWVRVRWYGNELHRPEVGVRIGWWALFTGIAAEALASGVRGWGILVALVLVALPVFGLARGLAALVTGLLDGTLKLQSATSSSSYSSSRDDYAYSSGSSGGDSSDSGGSFDGGGASDSW